MPNLTAFEKLLSLYESQTTFYDMLLVKYSIENDSFLVHDVIIKPIEKIHPDCLTIGALGKGQLQLKNSNSVCDYPFSRTDWINYMKKEYLNFWIKQKAKSEKMILKYS